MRIRRYLGYDCNSYDGFNNGHYVDEDSIEVKDHDEAFELCKQVVDDNYGIDGRPKDALTEDDDGYTLVTGHYDDSGNTISPEKHSELQDANENSASYRYVFCNYSVEE